MKMQFNKHVKPKHNVVGIATPQNPTKKQRRDARNKAFKAIKRNSNGVSPGIVKQVAFTRAQKAFDTPITNYEID
jgi:hypothetical protein